MPGIGHDIRVGKAGRPIGQCRRPPFPSDGSLLEAAIAHEQIEVLYQPLIEPRTGRIVGAEALARSSDRAVGRSLVCAGDAAPASPSACRGSSRRKALRCAAVWEGPLKGLRLSLNLLPRRLVARQDTTSGCSTRSRAPASIRRG